MSLSRNTWWGGRKSKNPTVAKAKLPRRRFQPSFETLEVRTVPTAGAFIQGTVFLDNNPVVPLNNSGTYVPGATVTLFTSDGITQLGQTTTDSNGHYLFSDSAMDVPGLGNNLVPGTYNVVETPPAGYANTRTQIISQIDPAVAIGMNTIQVTVPDPSTLNVTFNSNTFFSRDDWDYLDFTFMGSDQQNTAGQLPITVSGVGVPANDMFLTLCWDLNNSLQDGTNIYPVFPTPGQGTPANAGQIAYLYNHYATVDIADPGADNVVFTQEGVTPPLPTGTPAEAVGLQVAIWELEYGSNFSNVSVLEEAPGNPNTPAQELMAINTWASFYQGDAGSKSEAATFLQVDGPATLGGEQGVIAAGSFNFGNIGSPAINTTQMPATATVGSSIADQATVTGGDNPTGTVTFNLYSNATPSGTPLFTDTESLSGGMATSAGYTATAPGTDYWVATYNGDSNNKSVTSGATAEPVSITPNTPTINTSQQPASAVVGSSVADMATVTGLVNASSGDTVTFNLYSSATTQNSTTLLFSNTQTLTISSGTGTATSTGYTATASGTDYWVATFNGDSNNKSVTSGAIAEPVSITPNTPTINTSQQPASAVVGSSVADMATVTGLVDASIGDTVTFNLYRSATTQNSTTLLFSNTQTLTISSGTGTATSTGYTATASGTDYWVATFNGDSNNKSVTSGATAEPVSITPNTPTINTSQQPASAVVGSSVADKATVTGLVNASSGDTVTFHLYSSATTQNSTTLLFSNTQTLTISSGTGTATSTGYTATASGTDYWVATFNGDNNNKSVTSGATAEPVSITPNTPTINTNQQPASAIVGSSVADKATVTGLVNASSGDTVTFNLYSSATTQNSTTLLFSNTQTLTISSGTGTATSTGYTATASGTDYWVATFNGDSNNKSVTSGATAEPVSITPNTPTINTSQQPASATVGSSIADKATVTGLVDASSGDTVTFNLYSSATTQNSTTLLFSNTQTLTISSGTGTATSTGYTATASGTDYWVATFNGDSNNKSVTSGATAEPVSITPNTPTINTSQQPASASVGSSVADKATVSGLVNANSGDTVTFNLYSSATTQNSSTLLFSNTQTLSISGSTGTATSTGYTAAAVGTDYWVATFNGDSNNTAVTSGVTAEPVNITSMGPKVVTAASAGVALGSGGKLTDSATLSGGFNPTGTLTFYLFAPGVTPTKTDSNNVYSDAVTVSGNGTYTTSQGTNPGGYTPTVTGTYQWTAVYSGDANNAGASDQSSSPAAFDAALPTTATEVLTFPGAGTPPASYWSVTLSNAGILNGTFADWCVDTTDTASSGTSYAVKVYPTSGATIPAGLVNMPAGFPEVNYILNQNYVGKTDTTSGGTYTYGDVQLAIWTLVVSNPPNSTAGIGTYTQSHVNDILSQANANGMNFVPGFGQSVAVILQPVNSAGATDAQITICVVPTGAGEQTVVTPATPAINTTQQPASAIVGSSIADKATVTGLVSAGSSDTVTFNLYSSATTQNSSTLLFSNTQTLGISGSTGTATSTGYTATATGTDYWVASFNGDSNNNSVTSGATAEPVTVTPASPTITTSQGGTVVLGSGNALTDSATLLGGYKPTGTITFALYLPSDTGYASPVYTKTVTISGDGTYSGASYVPTTANGAGVYQWVATYNGDGNNVPVNSGKGSEPETVANGSPALGTIKGTKYLDITGNGFSSDDTPLSGVTIDLYKESNGTAGLQLGSGGDALVTSAKTDSNGNYSFTNLAAGTYYVQEVVPSGYIQTGGGLNTTPDGNTYYTITVSGSNTYSGNNFDDFQIPTCAPTNVWFTVYNSSCQATTVSDLRGNTQQGDTVCVTFTVPAGMNDQLTLVSYTAPGSSYNQATAYEQQIYDEATGTFKPGTYTICVCIPNCYYQIDFVCGPAINELAPPTYNGNPYGPDSGNVLYTPQGRLLSADNGGTQPCSTSRVVCQGDYAAASFWCTSNGQNLINNCNGSASSTCLAQWLVTHYSNLCGQGGIACLVNSNGSCFTNTQVAQACSKWSSPCQEVLSAALTIYCTDMNLAGSYAASLCSRYGLNPSSCGTGCDNFNVGSYGSCFGLPNYSVVPVITLLNDLNSNTSCGSTVSSGACTVFTSIDNTGHVTNTLSNLSGTAFSPAQIRAAYGISSLALDGTGQTVAVVDAYDDPAIFQSLDAFDTQFGLATTGPSLYAQYGPASSFLTVLNQNGQAAPLPSVDPSGAGTSNWEGETALDVEWLHAIAPGAKIILVEANSQALSNLMAGVGTAANQPGVSVVSMSWGFTEGLAVLQQDEAAYDQVLTTPAGHQGVTFVASTGDYGSVNPEYPAFSPNVVAVGGTSLYLNSDNSYSRETGWGYADSALGGTFIGTGGGVSMYEAEPAYQQGVQASGYRTTPDVSMVADPATGVWIADTYNLGSSNPWEAAGGTSLSAPSWAGLIVLADQGRAAAGHKSFDASGVSAQQALYNVPHSDFTNVTTGTNGGFNAGAGYNVVTGLGTPVAAQLIPHLIAYAGAVNAPAAAPTYLAGYQASRTGNTSLAEGVANMFNVYSFETAASLWLGRLAGGVATSATSRLTDAGDAPSTQQRMPTMVAAGTQLPEVFVTSPVVYGNLGAGTVAGRQVQVDFPVNQLPNSTVFVAPVLIQPSNDAGAAGDGWATLMDDVSDTLLMGGSDARSVFDTLSKGRSAASVADQLFCNPDLQRDLVFVPVPASAPASLAAEAGLLASGSDLWDDWAATDASDEG